MGYNETLKKEVTFPAAGGTDSVKVKNYSDWWIMDLRLPNFYSQYQSPTDSSIYNVDGFSFEGKWLYVYVPKHNQKWVVITVKPNNWGKERSIILDMTVGDAFRAITIRQGAQ